MKSLGWFVVVGAVVLGLPGCALTSKSDALEIRYFTPQSVKTRLSSAPALPATGEGQPMPALRLGHVTAGSHLRDKMVKRSASGEVTFADERRWTEKPDAFVRRALERELFEDRGYKRELTGGAPILDVEVLAFEEVKAPKGSVARVEVRVVLHDGEKVVAEETMTVDRPVGGSGAVEDVVTATAEALDATARGIADRVAGRLAPPKRNDSP